MPYREKTAWLSLLAMAVTFGPYFTIVVMGSHSGDEVPNLRQLGLFAATTLVQLLIFGAGHLILFTRSPVEARVPPDERDRAITRRSVSSAYYVLMAGTIYVGCVMPFNESGWTIINGALFMIIAAEMIRYSVIVVSYRRQA